MAGISTVLGLAFSIVGGVQQAAAQKAAGKQAKVDAEFRAQQEEMRANEERAAASRKSIERRKEKDLVLSRHRALASSSGLGALDPTIIDLASDVEAEGEYRADLEIALGENRARGLEDQAGATRRSGEAAYEAAKAKANSTLFGAVTGGVTSFFDKYGKSLSTASSGSSSSLRYG